jgi:uncharacterized membrane protein
MNGKIGLRIVSALVLIAALAGIGFFAFQAGVAQGSPITIEAPSGESVPAPYPYYGYGMPFHGPHFGFGYGLGCFGLLIPLLLFFLALKAFRFMLWGPGWGHMGHHGGRGPWGRHWEGGVPPTFEEWHKKAHGEQPEEKKE